MQFLQINPEQVLFVGHSLGSVIATNVCMRLQTTGCGLIIVAPFIDIRTVVSDQVPCPLNSVLAVLLKEENNLSVEKPLSCLCELGLCDNVLVVGCLHDGVVPYKHSVMLAEWYKCSFETLHHGHCVTPDITNVLEKLCL